MNGIIHTPEMHRRERVLDDWLDRIEIGQATVEECLAQHPELRDEMEPLLRAAQRLFMLEVAPLSSETIQGIHDQVLSRVPAGGKRGAPSRRLNFSLPWARLAGVAVALMLVLTVALAGAWRISANSLPGSPLYPIKRGVENTQLAFIHNPADRACLHIAFALRRVAEGLRLEQLESRWDEQALIAGLEELRLAEDAIDQAEKAGVAIDWRRVAELSEAGERSLTGVEFVSPSSLGLGDAFRSLEQRARRQLQTGHLTEPSPSNPEAGGTVTPGSAPADAALGSSNSHGEPEDQGRAGIDRPQGPTHLQQAANPTAGPSGQSAPSTRGREVTSQQTVSAAQSQATRTPGLKGLASGAFARVTATPHPTTAPTVAPTIAPTTAPDQGQSNAPQSSGESSGGQQNSGGGGSSGDGSGGGSSSGGNGGGSRAGGKK